MKKVFSGFLDKNGARIYVGDLLAYPVSVRLRDERVWPHNEWVVAAEDRFMQVVLARGRVWIVDGAHGFAFNSRCRIEAANLKEMTVARENHLLTTSTFA